MTDAIAKVSPITAAALEVVGKDLLSDPIVMRGLAAATRGADLVAEDEQLPTELLLLVIEAKAMITGRIKPVTAELEVASRQVKRFGFAAISALYDGEQHLRREIARIINNKKAAAEVVRAAEVKPADAAGPSMDATTVKPSSNIKAAGLQVVAIDDHAIKIHNVMQLLIGVVNGAVPSEMVKVELVLTPIKAALKAGKFQTSGGAFEFPGVSVERVTRTQVR